MEVHQLKQELGSLLAKRAILDSDIDRTKAQLEEALKKAWPVVYCIISKKPAPWGDFVCGRLYGSPRVALFTTRAKAIEIMIKFDKFHFYKITDISIEHFSGDSVLMIDPSNIELRSDCFI